MNGIKDVRQIGCYDFMDASGNVISVKRGIAIGQYGMQFFDKKGNAVEMWKFPDNFTVMPFLQGMWTACQPAENFIKWMESNGWYLLSSRDEMSGVVRVYGAPNPIKANTKPVEYYSIYKEYIENVLRDMYDSGDFVGAVKVYVDIHKCSEYEAFNAMMEIVNK